MREFHDCQTAGEGRERRDFVQPPSHVTSRGVYDIPSH
jgi:hypothetical protein